MQLAAQEPQIPGALAAHQSGSQTHARRVFDIGHSLMKLIHQKIQLQHLGDLLAGGLALEPRQLEEHAALRF
jgi:hypothetical protein